MIICEYGCEKEAKHQLKNGKWCCSKHHKSCPYSRIKNSQIRKNKHHTIETKQKISEAKKGKAISLEHKKKLKGKTPWNKGKTGIYSKETLLKMSESSKGKPGYWNGKNRYEETIKKIKQNHADIFLDKNPNWKGGISFEPYCQIWADKEYKESIKQRDGNICLNPACDRTNTTICIHHIDYIKKNCQPSNLITLCNSCNSKANKDRKWHKAWYSTIIKRRYYV